MTDSLTPDSFESRAADLKSRDEPFAIATVIRAAGATSAKPGAKALLDSAGSLAGGWLGGGCAREAVSLAAREAIRTGKPQLISVAPEEELDAKGVAAGETIAGMRFARSGCPSKGTIDIFIEPFTPEPELFLYGDSPVARALERLCGQFHWSVFVSEGDSRPASVGCRQRMAVVATQGQGDLAALEAALRTGASFVAFVSSRRKFMALESQLRAAGHDEASIALVKAPAGLDIGAVTPEEIALSIMAELTLRRRGKDIGA